MGGGCSFEGECSFVRLRYTQCAHNTCTQNKRGLGLECIMRAESEIDTLHLYRSAQDTSYSQSPHVSWSDIKHTHTHTLTHTYVHTRHHCTQLYNHTHNVMCIYLSHMYTHRHMPTQRTVARMIVLITHNTPTHHNNHIIQNTTS